MPEHLTPSAQHIIEQYLRLPFPHPSPDLSELRRAGGRNISCPYFNNRRARVRGALRVTIGKGTPKDIVEEAMIFALKEKVDLKHLTDTELKQFLVDHHLGADCSGLVYHILDAELREKKNKSLASALHFPHATTVIRKILTRLRPAENTSVATLAHEHNSFSVPFQTIQSGDLIILQGFGPTHDRDHVLFVHTVEPGANSQELGMIGYTHALAWVSDGIHTHGVRQGVIEILDLKKSLTDQYWTEQEKTGQDNETWRHAAEAQTLTIRRLKF